MTRTRRAGILLHPTSLPGAHGSGDFGAAAFHFIDWLVAGGQTLWQVLPLSGIGPGNSPYMSSSAFAGNPLLIDLARLCTDGWLDPEELVPPVGFESGRVNYPLVERFRMAALRRAAERFFANGDASAGSDFAAYCSAAGDWLEDYALFKALAAKHGRPWQKWPHSLARRASGELAVARRGLQRECAFWRFCQWSFDRQWKEIKAYANARGVQIVGDVPIFIADDSADVWSHPELFDLADDGRPRVIAGVPPDYFSATGQRWGNPLYRWPAHAADGYRWWVARMEQTMGRFDVIRLDHFRGFESYWEIPSDAEDAVGGRWQPGPGASLFKALRSELGELAIIAEDLGIITRPVTALRRELGLPGMKILQFAFDGKCANPYLPHNHEADAVVYTGTHDNDTTVGWWRGLSDKDRDYVRRYLGINGEAIHWDLIRVASASVASMAIVPMQDVLGLGAEHRMNRPGVAAGNWEWRFCWDQVAAWHAETLSELARLHGRFPGAGDDDESNPDPCD